MRRIFIAVVIGSSLAVPALAQLAAKPAAPKPSLERAYALKDQKRMAESLAAFNAVLKQDPENAAARKEAGYLYAALKQHAAAARNLAAASAREPEDMRLRMDLAYSYAALKKHDLALEQFQVVASKPGEFQVPAQEAAAETERMKAGGETDAKRQALLDKGYAAVARRDRATARRAFTALLGLDPKDAVARKQRGFISLEEGRLSEAAADFEAVLAFLPNDHLTALQLGYTYDRMKKKEQARASFTAALDSDDEKIREAAQTALQADGAPSAPAAPL